MAKKTASKTSSKVQAEFIWGIGEKVERPNNNELNKSIKKMRFGTFLLALFFIAIGVGGGFLGLKYLTKNDCFELIGKDEITLQIGKETYADEGAKVIAFGKNDENKLKIETNLKKNDDGTYYAEEEGTYYIIYTVDNIKYGTLFKVQKIRLITFVEATEQDEIDAANQGGSV